MKRTWMKAGLAGLVFALSSSHAMAQGQSSCAPRDHVLDRLSVGYGETRQGVGLAANNALVEVFASKETGSWTITVTTPNGLTCLVATGESYEQVSEALPTDDNDA